MNKIKRNKEIKVRLSLIELENLNKCVKKTGLSREEYIRTLISGYVPAPRISDDVKEIISERFQASDTIPVGKEMCPKCKRKLLFRVACYPNTKQIPICDRIFKKHRVSNGRMQHYVMDVGMKFHATEYSQMQVEGIEDNWIIKGLDSEHMELWHNNYVKTSSTERYITDGYHNQKVERGTLGQLLY